MANLFSRQNNATAHTRNIYSVFFFLKYDDLTMILTTLYLTKMRGARLAEEYTSGDRCPTCRHAKQS